MYLNHFNLAERPFSITPDPRFLYMSACHREALAHLLYGLGEGGGFVQLTGEVGTGKTTICRCLMEQVPKNVDIAVILNPKITAEELIATVLDELGVDYAHEIHSIKILTDVLNEHLLKTYAQGRRTVLIIDEAQNLSAEVLEQIRLLTNLETATQKLLQIILIGQPELREMLARDEMRQLAQRVTARYHLEPISRADTGAYIQHRLQVCGTSHVLFNKGAIDQIHRLSGGIPRLINVLCDRAMLGAYVEGKSYVDREIVRKAAEEVLEHRHEEAVRNRWLPLATGGLALTALLAVVLYFRPWQQVDLGVMLSASEPQPVAAEVAAAPESAPAPEIISANTGQEPASQTTSIALAVTGLQTPVAPEEPEMDAAAFAELLGTADSSWYRRIWTDLFAQWTITLPAGVKPDFCDFAVRMGLHCLIEKGNWASLRLFDRPAILKLKAADGQYAPVLLQRLEDEYAELLVAGEPLRVALAAIEPYWDGQSILLLRAPPGGTMYMELGGKGPDVAWLRQQLELIQDRELASDDPLTFDYGLYKQVLAFQREHGLVADGIVGRHTIILLNSKTQQGSIPRLSAKRT
jgi:general secretion pathway protein A